MSVLATAIVARIESHLTDRARWATFRANLANLEASRRSAGPALVGGR